MAYPLQIIQAQPTSNPIIDIGVAPGFGIGLDGSAKFKKVDLDNWWWKPEATADPTKTNTDQTSMPVSVGTYQYRAFVPREAIPGLPADSYVMTFMDAKIRMLSFKTKLRGTFTLTFQIIAGGNHPSATHNHEIYGSESKGSDTLLNAGVGFSHTNNHWPAFWNQMKVNIAYNTDTFQETGTWTTIRELHARPGESPDFSTNEFTTITQTFTLPADAYVGIVQLGRPGDNYGAWALANVTLTYATASLPAYSIIETTTFTDHWDGMQKTLNGGLEASDISTTPWVETYHMKPMRFFGSPAPRIEALSGDIHYRREITTSMLYDGQGEEFMPVHGLATTIHVAPPFNDTTVTALVRCNFLANEVQGGPLSITEQQDLADFALFVKQGNGQPQMIRSSFRNLYRQPDNTHVGIKNISIINRVDLSVGINHVYIGIRFSGDKLNRGRVHIQQKIFVVDVKYI